MKNICLVFSIVITNSIQLAAQDSTWLIVQPGQFINEVLKPEVIYRYPQFTDGKVYFVGGGRAEAKLNYNRFMEEFEFIDKKGDTLIIAEKLTVRLISILNDTFYYNDGFIDYNDGYIELIHNYGSVKLAAHERIKLADKQKIGAFGQKNSGVSIDALGVYIDRSSRVPLLANEELKFKREDDYFLSKKANYFFLANKKNILKEFSEHRSELQGYFNKNNFNSSKKEDVEKLCEFIQAQRSKN